MHFVPSTNLLHWQLHCSLFQVGNDVRISCRKQWKLNDTHSDNKSGRTWSCNQHNAVLNRILINLAQHEHREIVSDCLKRRSCLFLAAGSERWSSTWDLKWSSYRMQMRRLLISLFTPSSLFVMTWWGLVIVLGWHLMNVYRMTSSHVWNTKKNDLKIGCSMMDNPLMKGLMTLLHDLEY